MTSLVSAIFSKITPQFLQSKKIIIKTWSFDKKQIPTLFIADGGSGISDHLTDICRQAIGKEKTVFYFNAYSDINRISMLSDWAQRYSRGSNYYVNSHVEPLSETSPRYELADYKMVLRNSGILTTILPALERCHDEAVARYGKIVESALSDIVGFDRLDEVVIVVDGIHYFDETVQNLLSTISQKGAHLFLRTSSFRVNNVSFDPSKCRSIVMKISLPLEEISYLSTLGLTTQHMQQWRYGEAIDLNTKTPFNIAFSNEHRKFPFVCANKEL